MSAARRKAISDGLAAFAAQASSPKPLQILYSTKPNWPGKDVSGGGGSGAATKPAGLDIAVLDSSFNPPTKAHAALALSSPVRAAAIDKGSSSSSAARKGAYDAHLLLFSVRNADKGTGKAGDASTVQRLEMMHLLAHDVEARLRDEDREASVAVALVEEPLMIAKSTLIHQYLGPAASAQTSLHWVVGMDTLERFFQVKYYPSPRFFEDACGQFFEKERTRFVCARRGPESLPNSDKARAGGSSSDDEDKFLRSDPVARWLDCGSVAIIDLPAEAQGISSTAVRSLASALEEGKQAGTATEEELKRLTTPSIAKYLIDESVYQPPKKQEDSSTS
ncbi:hypothetical protein FA10DRAFT_268276 [Acaromyces ingoldii]|uniref:Nucleotidylyl transferase n=1 Tax=Acaromyces ingoldii TaxID=215250 RepID=A0A316YF72_9BASI|nr:hypothetical protein FA10DRAFT_268276 [Acaromyces ingoldii]PWN88057.1 hypothetical protein FA10DRAFT_268276 [Acaromyces ingoldii]